MGARMADVERWLRCSKSEAELTCLAESSSQAQASSEEDGGRRSFSSPYRDQAPRPAESSDECIPGVPEDVLLEILARTPRGAAFSLRHVSHAWRRAVSSSVIRHTRAASGQLEQWLFVLPEFPRGGPFRALDPVAHQWHTLPPIPIQRGHPIAPSSSSPSSSPSSSSSQHSTPMTTPGSSPSSSPPRFGADCPLLEGFACAGVSGKLLVIGGVQRALTADGGVTKTVTSAVWEFDPASWSWAAAPSMGTGRGWCAAAVVADRYVHVSGGQGAGAFLKASEVYDAEERVWRKAADMNLARCRHRSVVVGGRVFVVAGELERHDPAHLRAQPPARPVLHAAPPHRTGPRLQFPPQLPLRLRPGNFFRQQAQPVAAAPAPLRVPAGNASMEVYDADADRWTLLPDSWISGSKVPCPVASVNGKLYAVHQSSVHMWDEDNASWRHCGDTPGRDAQGRPVHVSGFGCAEVAGKLLLFGGSRDVWINRTRLTHQNMGTVHAWQPPDSEGEGGAEGGGAGGLAGSGSGSISLGLFKRLVCLALWCCTFDQGARPNMQQVVKVLSGIAEGETGEGDELQVLDRNGSIRAVSFGSIPSF